ncbi:MAG TPA: M2 family metallopeptidase, partial [Thermoanaerobaculia bacterium]
MPFRIIFAGFAAALFIGCATTPATVTPAPTPAGTEATAMPQSETMTAETATPTAEDARRFVQDAETRLAALNVEANRAQWVASNFITVDTQAIAARENERFIAAGVELAKDAARYDNVPNLDYDTRRKLDLIKLKLTSPGPSDPAKTAEMTRIAAELEATYGAGKY